MVDVAGGEVAGGDAQVEGPAGIPGKVGGGAQFENPVDAGEGKCRAESDLDVFAKGESPDACDLGAEVGDRTGEELRRRVEREGELIVGHTGRRAGAGNDVDGCRSLLAGDSVLGSPRSGAGNQLMVGRCEV